MNDIDLQTILDKITFDKTNNYVKESVGTLKEKSIHKFLKYYVSLDSSFHECLVKGKLVDCFVNNHIYEIQTRSFYKLKDKLKTLLPFYKVTIIYPVYVSKILYEVDDNFTVISQKKSPKKGNPLEICSELYSIIDYIDNPNLSFKIVLFDIIEYVHITIKGKYKHKNVIDRIPVKVHDIIDIDCFNKMILYLPTNILNKPFKAKDFYYETKLCKKGKVSHKASNAFQVFKKLGIFKVLKKEGNSYIYTINK